MQEKVLTADELASVLILDKDHTLEPVPEPFRGQPTLRIVVPFNAYKEFLSMLPKEFNMLSMKIDMSSESKLLKSFYTDMAFAVCKELYFAAYTNKQCTYIEHAFSEKHPQYTKPIQNQNVKLLCTLLARRGFPLATQIAPANKFRWVYACRLFESSLEVPPPIWSC